MFSILEKYQTSGQFSFKIGERLADHCRNIPNLPGVYLFYAVKSNEEKLVYVGASGKMKQNGTFGVQKLRKRLQNMQTRSIRRQSFFENQIEEHEFDAIKVTWYVTFDNRFSDLPTYVEANLLQNYFESHKKLPVWNREI